MTPSRSQGLIISVNAELIGIEVIVAALAWIAAIPAAFYFVGPAVGFVVIVGGLLLFAWWLATLIRQPADNVSRDPDQP
jgi:hypothetical protein